MTRERLYCLCTLWSSLHNYLQAPKYCTLVTADILCTRSGSPHNDSHSLVRTSTRTYGTYVRYKEFFFPHCSLVWGSLTLAPIIIVLLIVLLGTNLPPLAMLHTHLHSHSQLQTAEISVWKVYRLPPN